MFVLYCIVLFYTILIFVFVLYCNVLYFIVLYCILLYCIVLYCIILYFSYLIVTWSVPQGEQGLAGDLGAPGPFGNPVSGALWRSGVDDSLKTLIW